LLSAVETVERALESWGLGPKEIKIYLALLELGQATTSRLSEVTRINRTTLYDILQTLKDKGLVGVTIAGPTSLFYASKPEVLVDTLREKERAVREVLPELRKRMNIIGKRPRMEFYEGSKGIDAISQDILTAKQIRVYGSYVISSKTAKYQALDFRKKRIALRIPAIVITDEKVTEIEMLKQKKYRSLTKIFVNGSLAQVPTLTYIYENKVAVLSFEKEQFFGFVIESPSIAIKERFLFDTLLRKSRTLL